MTAQNLDRALPLEALKDEDRKKNRGASLLLPFPSKHVMPLPSTDRREKLRILEALLFAACQSR